MPFLGNQKNIYITVKNAIRDVNCDLSKPCRELLCQGHLFIHLYIMYSSLKDRGRDCEINRSNTHREFLFDMQKKCPSNEKSALLKVFLPCPFDVPAPLRMHAYRFVLLDQINIWGSEFPCLMMTFFCSFYLM